MNVVSAQKSHVTRVAELHKIGIPTGFISSLPKGLIRRLYLTIQKQSVLLVLTENERVIGFISCAESTGRLYKQFFLRHVFSLVPVFFIRLFQKGFLKKSLETLKAPKKTKLEDEIAHLPELLSIVIDPENQAGGLGFRLLEALENRLVALGYKEYKVVAGDRLVSANKFYQKHGFERVLQTEIHAGDVSNIYVKKLK